MTNNDKTIRQQPLLLSRRFMPLFVSQIFGAFNDQFLKLALITMVTWKELSMAGIPPEQLVPIAGGIFTGFFFLFSGMAGQVADKFDKALVLIRVKQAEIIIMILAAIGLVFHQHWLLLICVGLMGAQSAFFSPTRNAVLPEWLSKNELVTGNALINGFVAVSVLLGQGLGSYLIITKGGPLFVAGLLLLFAVLGLYAISKAPPAPSTSPEIKIDYLIFPTILKTLGFAAKRPKVFRPMLGTAWYYWLVAAVLILMPTYIKSVLHYERSVFITIMVIFTIGALVGALATMVFNKLVKNALLISAIGALGIIASTLDLFWLGEHSERIAFVGAGLGDLPDFLKVVSAKRFMFDLGLAAFSASLFVIPLNALAQERADKKHRARLLAAGALLLNASTTLSQLSVYAMSKMGLAPHFAYLPIAFVTIFVLVYVTYRARILRKEML